MHQPVTPSPCAVRRGQRLLCLDVPRTPGREEGFALYPGEVYVAAADSYTHEGRELVELEANGDGEPCTHYPVRFFRVADAAGPAAT